MIKAFSHTPSLNADLSLRGTSVMQETHRNASPVYGLPPHTCSGRWLTQQHIRQLWHHRSVTSQKGDFLLLIIIHNKAELTALLHFICPFLSHRDTYTIYKMTITKNRYDRFYFADLKEPWLQCLFYFYTLGYSVISYFYKTYPSKETSSGKK